MVLPVLLLSSLINSSRSHDILLLRDKPFLDVLQSLPQVKPELRVDDLGLGLQQVLVDTAFLNDAPVGLHWHRDLEVLAQDLAKVGLAHNVGLHRDEWIFHRETSLEALPVLFAVEETFLVFTWLGRGVGPKHVLLNGGELRKLKWLQRKWPDSGKLLEERLRQHLLRF
jgi:hypothetical protein